MSAPVADFPQIAADSSASAPLAVWPESVSVDLG
jgi:hypothetical protein